MSTQQDKIDGLLIALYAASNDGDWVKIRKLDRIIVNYFNRAKTHCDEVQRHELAERIKHAYRESIGKVKSRMDSTQADLATLQRSKEGMVAYSGIQGLTL